MLGVPPAPRRRLSSPSPQLIMMALGAVLLLVGAPMVVVQIYFEVKTGTSAAGNNMGGLARHMKLTTSYHYAGSIIAAIGAALEVIAFVATRPWRNVRKSN
jgi:hypothetical protein